MAILRGVQVTKVLAGKLRRAGIDIFCWKGLTVLRSWPRPPRHPKTEKQVRWWAVFRDLAAQWRALSLYDKAQYRDEARGYGFTGYCLFLQRGLKAWLQAHPENC
jgi:hypothetical protein